jgi:hypothetical protein
MENTAVKIQLKCIQPFYDRTKDEYIKPNDTVVVTSKARADQLIGMKLCEEVKEEPIESVNETTEADI